MHLIEIMHWTSFEHPTRLDPVTERADPGIALELRPDRGGRSMTSANLPPRRSALPPVGRRIAIVPSLLDVDFARLGDEVVALDQAGADRLQWDVMDGRFVPRMTHGPDLVRSVRGLTDLPFEAHLMVEHPEAVWPQFADAGANLLIVHVETTRHLHLVLGAIRAAGCAAGVALNPATPIETIRYVVDLIDLVLIMTVNPGWGGQPFIPEMLDKVSQARALLDGAGSPADIEVDGGVTDRFVGELCRHGANVLVAGSAVHRHPAGRSAAIRSLRAAAGTSTSTAVGAPLGPEAACPESEGSVA